MPPSNSDAQRSLFISVKDTNTGKIKKVVIPSDLQVGLVDNPASLDLFGRISLSVSDYHTTLENQGRLRVSDHDSIVSIFNDAEVPVQMDLPTAPRKGQVHFFKDASGNATTYPITLAPAANVLIDDDESKLIDSDYGTLAIYWHTDRWRVLLSASGSSGGSSGTGSVPPATFLTVDPEPALGDSRRLIGSTNIDTSDGGAGSDFTLDLSDTTVTPGSYSSADITVDEKGRITAASSSAAAVSSFITVNNEAGLANERRLSSSFGIVLVDGGPGSTLSLQVNDSDVATLTGSLFRGPVSASAGLSGSLQRVGPNLPYLLSQGSITITTMSNGQIVISSTAGTSSIDAGLTPGLFFSNVDNLVSASSLPTIGSGSFTTGNRFVVQQASTFEPPVIIRGARFFTALSQSTIRIKLWAPSGAAVAAVDVPITTSGTYSGYFGTASYTPSGNEFGGNFHVSAWQTSGLSYTRQLLTPLFTAIAVGTTPTVVGYKTIQTNTRIFSAGDAVPASTAGTEQYPIEPILGYIISATSLAAAQTTPSTAPRMRYHTSTFAPLVLIQFSGSMLDIGSQAVVLTSSAPGSQERYTPAAPAFKSMFFDGASAFVTTSSLPSLMYLTGNSTVEVLCKLVPSSSSQTIVHLGGVTGDNGTLIDNFIIQFFIDSLGRAQYVAEFGNNGENIGPLVSTESIPFNQWIHLAIVNQLSGASLSSGTTSWYVNGDRIGVSPVHQMPNKPPLLTTSSLRLYVGATAQTIGSGGFSGIASTIAAGGMLASLKILSGALTQPEIYTEFSSTLGPLYF